MKVVTAALVLMLSLPGFAKSSKGTLTGIVNINEANVAQLTLLPGVGPKKAQAIREYVQAHPFKSVDELKEVKGIGDAQLEKLRAHVTVFGPTTAKWVTLAPPRPSSTSAPSLPQ